MGHLTGNVLRIVLLSLLVAAVFAPTRVQAQDYTVGVKAGDWVKYGQITVNWIGNGTEPSSVTDAKKIGWMRTDVLNVTGTTASLNFTTHYINGTQTFLSLDVNVQILHGIGSAFLIACNLKPGDQLTQQTSLTINQTVTRMFAGADRTVNTLDSTGIFGETKTYWDQKTGIMVETYFNITLGPAYPGGYVEESWKATETNLWSANALDLIQNNLIYVIAGIAVVIVIVAATIFFRRRRKPPRTQQTSPPPFSSPPTPS
jgi:hypothetical protein